MRNITLKEFNKWLDKRHPRSRAGKCGDPNHCVLAHALLDLNPDAIAVAVGGGEIEFGTIAKDEFGEDNFAATKVIDTKAWQNALIRKFDEATYSSSTYATSTPSIGRVKSIMQELGYRR